MTKGQKTTIEEKVNRIWRKIEELEKRSELANFMFKDTEHEQINAEIDILCGELRGINYVVESMGYTVVCLPDLKTRKIVTINQYHNYSWAFNESEGGHRA